VDLHTISLELGDVSTSVEVQAEFTQVATDSSDHSINLDTIQIEDTPIRRRNYEA